MLKPRLRILLAATAALCTCAGVPAPAVASRVRVSVCRHADGSVAPTDGWQFAIADDAMANDITTNSCALGGQIDLELARGRRTAAGSRRPPARRLVRRHAARRHGLEPMQVWWAYRANPSRRRRTPATSSPAWSAPARSAAAGDAAPAPAPVAASSAARR